MIIALTGTPGTGKSSVSKILQKNGVETVDLNKVVVDKDFLIAYDEIRDSKIADVDKLNDYIKKSYGDKNLVFVQGHLSHLLKNVDKVVILRCHPNKLQKRLFNKGWEKKKIEENVEAEILDVILCETMYVHLEKNVFEIDTTDESADSAASMIMELIRNKFKHIKKYDVGRIDWSEEILKGF